MEMLVAAIGLEIAFPYKEYAGANIGISGGFRGNLYHALKFNDFYHDTVHQFAPTYHDYVLYNNESDSNSATKYRSRTFVPTGPEMDNARKTKPDSIGSLEELQLSAVPKSETTSGTSNQVDLEAIKSSLLKESVANQSRPHDLSNLMDTDLNGNNTDYPAEVPAVMVDVVVDSSKQ